MKSYKKSNTQLKPIKALNYKIGNKGKRGITALGKRKARAIRQIKPL